MEAEDAVREESKEPAATSSPPQEQPPAETSPPQEEKQEPSPYGDGLDKGSNGSHGGSSGKHSVDKLSRSKLQYEADPEDLELRQKLLESRMARKKTEEDAKVLMNRLLLLKNEEQKVRPEV